MNSNSRCNSGLTLISATASGFTLIEVMISLVILTFISLGIYQATTEAYRIRDVIAAEGEFYSSIRMSMDILRRDVAALYSPVIARAPKKTQQPNLPTAGNPAAGLAGQPDAVDANGNNPKDMEAINSSDAGRTSAFWLPATDKTALRPSRFVGTERKLSFVAVSHIRIYKDAPESVFAKVTYDIERDEDDKSGDTNVLVKTESTGVFDDDERRDRKQVHTFKLLHGIKKLRYRYWRKDKDRWETSWDSDKDDYKEKYPDLVEVTFEVTGPERLSFEGVYKLKPEIPLRGMDPSS
jgi:prepilin-type N-terminal cleavage/methylation domain-containing protein